MARLIVLIYTIMMSIFPTNLMAQSASASFQVGLTVGGVARARADQLTYTWGAAAVSVSAAGYENVQRVEKTTTVYWFKAQRGGGNFRVAVSIVSGAVVMIVAA